MQAIDEINLYHGNVPEEECWIVLARKDQEDGFRQEFYEPWELPQAVERLDRERDTWISQAYFGEKRRRNDCFLGTRAVYVDLDTYRTATLGRFDPESQLDLMLEEIDTNGILRPSLINYSGQGFHAKYLLDCSLGEEDLPLFHELEASLIRRYDGLGVDPAVKDPARILRVVETRNTKTNRWARNMFPRAGKPTVYDLETICFELLDPVPQLVLPLPSVPQLSVSSEKNTAGLVKFNAARLGMDRMADLYRLLQLRGWDVSGVPDGCRNNFRLAAAACMGCYLNPQELRREITDFSLRHIPGSTQRLVDSKLASLFRRHEEHWGGVRVLYGDHPVTPFYRYSNEGLIQLLSITRIEQEQLRTIICRDIAVERHRERNRKESDRETYLQAAVERNKIIWDLYQQGINYKEMAELMSSTVPAMKQAVQRLKKKQQECD